MSGSVQHVRGAGEHHFSRFRGVRGVMLALALACLAIALPAVAARADIHAGFTPSSITVAPGDTFTVDLAITLADSAFNAFDASIRFDPSRLTFVPTSPVGNQRGALMTNACANTFHLFSAAPDSLKITLSLLCSATFVTGPGVIYRVKFQAGLTTGTTVLSLGPFTEFYKAGIYARPLFKQTLTVTIGTPTGVEGETPARSGLDLAPPAPNPRRGSGAVILDFALPSHDLVSFDVLDLMGRRVAGRGTERLASGRYHLAWTPPVLPSGDYFLRLRTLSNGSVTRRWTVLR
jgi:hypothetical protein